MPDDRRSVIRKIGLGAPLLMAGMAARAAPAGRQTSVAIAGNAFFINGQPTYPGRSFRGGKVEGQLFTSRMVNCIVNDQNPETRGMWAYRDGPWDPERNTSEFIAALPLYRRHGLTSIAFNIQGGSPMGYGWHQPWHTSGYTPDGRLLPDYRSRLLRVLDAADANGMVAVLGLFYISATPALANEAAVIRATDEITDLVCDGGYTNVLIEVGNECDIPRWPYDIIQPARSHELVARIQARSQGRVKTQGRAPVGQHQLCHAGAAAGAAAADGRLCALSRQRPAHAAGCACARQIRSAAAAGYRGQPLLINEDDHFDFDKPDNNMLASVAEYSGWGYFDYRQIREPFEDGYQSLPVDWGINSARKKGFFSTLAEVTGAAPL